MQSVPGSLVVIIKTILNLNCVFVNCVFLLIKPETVVSELVKWCMLLWHMISCLFYFLARCCVFYCWMATDCSVPRILWLFINILLDTVLASPVMVKRKPQKVKKSANQYGRPRWQTRSIFSCSSKGFGDDLVTSQNKVMWSFSQSQRHSVCPSVLLVGSYQRRSLASVSAANVTERYDPVVLIISTNSSPTVGEARWKHHFSDTLGPEVCCGNCPELTALSTNV